MEPATPLPTGLAALQTYQLEIRTFDAETFRFLVSGQHPPVLRKDAGAVPTPPATSSQELRPCSSPY